MTRGRLLGGSVRTPRKVRVRWDDTTLPAIAFGQRRPDGRVRPLFTRRTAQKVLRLTEESVRYGIDAEMLSPEAAFSFRWEGERVVGEGGPDGSYRFSRGPVRGRYALFPDDDWQEVTPPLPRRVPDAWGVVRFLERPSPDRKVHIRWLYLHVPPETLVEALRLAVATATSPMTRFILAGIVIQHGGAAGAWAAELKARDPEQWVREWLVTPIRPRDRA